MVTLLLCYSFHLSPRFLFSLIQFPVPQPYQPSDHAVSAGNQTQVLPQCNDSVSEPAGSAASQESAATCSGEGSQGTRKPFSFPVKCSSGLILSSDRRQLRLVDGGGPCAGRVEILHQGSWGTICDDSWDLRDAHVVCRQLGCGAALNATVSAHFGEGSDPIWLDDLMCTGKESHIWKCPSQGWGQHNCRHKEDAGVICSGLPARCPQAGPGGGGYGGWESEP